MKVLVIEDDTPIAAVVRRGLEEARYGVTVVSDGTRGLRLALEEEYALIILDLMLPGLNGWKVCETLRSQRVTTPILMLTAREGVHDRVRGLEIGADDYLPKPFDFTELLARVRALLRRDKLHKTRVLRVADLEIDTGSRRITRAGQEVILTPREYELLEALATNEGRVLTRDLILNQVWSNEDSYSNTVDVHIGTLRRKIDTGHADRLIHTVRGLGYVLKRPDTEASG